MKPIREIILREVGKKAMAQGCRSFTMDTIAKSMNVSKKTLYNLFPDKSEMIKQAVILIIEEWQTELQTNLPKEGNAIEKCFYYIQQSFIFSKSICEDFIKEMPRYFSDEEIETHILKRDTLLKELLLQGQKEKYFIKEIDWEFLNVLISYRPYSNILSNHEKWRNFAAGFIFIMLRGISTSKGITYIDTYLKNLIERKSTKN